MSETLVLMFMSGVDDGKTIAYSTGNGDGEMTQEGWLLTIGRHHSRDISLQRDSFISREHALLTRTQESWWLRDLESRNGSFIEAEGEEIRISEPVLLRPGQLFKLGRTWLRIQPVQPEEDTPA